MEIKGFKEIGKATARELITIPSQYLTNKYELSIITITLIDSNMIHKVIQRLNGADLVIYYNGIEIWGGGYIDSNSYAGSIWSVCSYGLFLNKLVINGISYESNENTSTYILVRYCG